MLRNFTATAKNDAPRVLYENEYVQVLDRDGYYYWHEKQNLGVALLVYRGNGFEFLGRFELNPAHSTELEACSITGKIDGGETARLAAIRELKEETGYQCGSKDLEELGLFYPFKSSDYRLHGFAIDVSGQRRGKAKGDGSKAEEKANCKWLSRKELLQSNDAIVGALVARWLLG